MTAARQLALQLDNRDNVLIALANLRRGDEVAFNGCRRRLTCDVPPKHKFAARDLAPGDAIVMYGAVVGRARRPIREGELLTLGNIGQDPEEMESVEPGQGWTPPDVSRWRSRTFNGFRRRAGQAGTRNYWIVAPLVFCEARNLEALKEALETELGYAAPSVYRSYVAEMARLFREGRTGEIAERPPGILSAQPAPALFRNVDGIKFLMHAQGCGGTREDARNLCGLLAGYISHPNVAGATVLSLGCQHAEAELLREELHRRDPGSSKPLHIFEQQRFRSESDMLARAVRDTFLGLAEADREERQPVSISELKVAVKCGASDGFSGISANPAVGRVADLVVALGGAAILAEFPELHGVERDFIRRSASRALAERFRELMEDYTARARASRSGLELNPSPGNMREGLLTGAMKSAGAARKGGTSPVTDVIDYPGWITKPGLNLLCTPGNDVESVTAQVGAGANLVLFTTGMGTPTGNPIAPVLKIASHSDLANRMADIIDFDAGGIISGDETPEQTADRLLEAALKVASGAVRPKSELSRQDNFIPWKRGISL